MAELSSYNFTSNDVTTKNDAAQDWVGYCGPFHLVPHTSPTYWPHSLDFGRRFGDGGGFNRQLGCPTGTNRGEYILTDSIQSWETSIFVGAKQLHSTSRWTSYCQVHGACWPNTSASAKAKLLRAQNSIPTCQVPTHNRQKKQDKAGTTRILNGRRLNHLSTPSSIIIIIRLRLRLRFQTSLANISAKTSFVIKSRSAWFSAQEEEKENS